MSSFTAFVMAVERVERRLRRITAVLDAEQIPYAVVGGNAVAAWVARADPSATRTTKDVDLLVRRADLERITALFHGLGFVRADPRSQVLFLDPEAPSRRSGVHLVWADERVRPSYVVPVPSVEETEVDPEGSRVLSLAALVCMKLTSYRDVDRVHVVDLLSVGLVDESLRGALPPELRQRLETIERQADD